MTNNWKRLPDAWIDKQTGLTWHAGIAEAVNVAQAKAIAKERGLRLPTEQELRQAYENGARDVMPADWDHKLFWTSKELNPDFQVIVSWKAARFGIASKKDDHFSFSAIFVSDKQE